MAEETGIEWCDSTWSGWIGCTKVSTAEHGGGACDNCYAEALNKRFSGGGNWGPGAPRRRTSDANWKLPASWNRNAISFALAHDGRKRRVFLNNQADIFDNEVADELRAEVFALIEATPNLEWLMLTKRIGNAKHMLPAAWLEPGGWPKNIRLGITLCNQPEANRDIPKLLALGCPNFVSIEPLLGSVDLTTIGQYTCGWRNMNALRGSITDGTLAMSPSQGSSSVSTTFGNPTVDWVIVGGESGPKARPMHPDWVRSLRDQCEDAGVPFMFKQWGEFVPVDVTRTEFLNPLPHRMGERVVNLRGELAAYPDIPDEAFQVMRRVGKKAAGRLLDGITHDGFPTS